MSFHWKNFWQSFGSEDWLVFGMILMLIVIDLLLE
jgi:hypothetical protein